jgi:hypothetical protein
MSCLPTLPSNLKPHYAKPKFVASLFGNGLNRKYDLCCVAVRQITLAISRTLHYLTCTTGSEQ